MAKIGKYKRTKNSFLRSMTTRNETAYQNKDERTRGRRSVQPVTLPAMPWDKTEDKSNNAPARDDGK